MVCSILPKQNEKRHVHEWTPTLLLLTLLLTLLLFSLLEIMRDHLETCAYEKCNTEVPVNNKADAKTRWDHLTICFANKGTRTKSKAQWKAPVHSDAVQCPWVWPAHPSPVLWQWPRCTAPDLCTGDENSALCPDQCKESALPGSPLPFFQTILPCFHSGYQ